MFIVSRVWIWVVDDGDGFFGGGVGWGVVRVKLSFESNKVHRGSRKECYEEFSLGNKNTTLPWW